MTIAATVQQILLIYGAVGMTVGLAFLLVGIDRMDASAAGAYAVRPLLLPGLVLLWPIVAFRWLRFEVRR